MPGKTNAVRLLDEVICDFGTSYASLTATWTHLLRARLQVDADERRRQLVATLGPFQPRAEELVTKLILRSSEVIQQATEAFSSTALGALESENIVLFGSELLPELFLPLEPFSVPSHVYQEQLEGFLKAVRLFDDLLFEQLQASEWQLQRAYSCVAAAVLRARRLPERAIGLIASLRHPRSCCRRKTSSSDDEEDSHLFPSEPLFGHYRKGRRGGDETNRFRAQVGSSEGQASRPCWSPLEGHVGRRDSANYFAGAPFFGLARADGISRVAYAPVQRRRTRTSAGLRHQRHLTDPGRWLDAIRPRRVMIYGAHS